MHPSYCLTMKKYIILTYTICLLLLSNCGIYTFSGTSVHPDVKTCSIESFPNLASIVQPSLSQTFTEKLKDKCAASARLEITTSGGDIEFTGAVMDYSVNHAAAAANDQSTLNRLNISIRVEYTNNVTNENWSETFSQVADFDQNSNLTAVEGTLIDEITDLLVESIFNKAFGDW